MGSGQRPSETAADARPRASVVVCTHARSKALGDCLAHLVAHQAEIPWEIVVVDNASPDDTHAVAVRAVAGSPVPARVIAEPRLGLSAARNAGIAASRGAVVVFLDDDAFPHPGWLEALAAAFENPRVEAAGGPIDPRFDGPLPEWLGPRYLPYLSAWDRGPDPHSLAYNEYPRGASLALRRTALERIGAFSRRLGRTGLRLLSCEEIELCLRLERTGGEILYVPEARVDHLVPTGRLDAFWMARRFHWQGRSEAILEWMHGGLGALRIGLGRSRRHARQARESGDLLAAAFHRATAIGYRIGSLAALVRVSRWRGRGAAPWRPFS